MPTTALPPTQTSSRPMDGGKASAREKFFQVGGTLSATAPSYVSRAADQLLVETLTNRDVALVLAPRQSGKSSLMVRATEALRHAGQCHPVIIDLQELGEEIDRRQFFESIAWKIGDALSLQTDLMVWWEATSALSPPVQFHAFVEKIALPECEGDIVLLFDEIDSALRLPFSDELFTTLRALFNARAHTPILNRLTFALIGTASPTQFILDKDRTPFNIGIQIPIDDFDSKNVEPFRKVLGARSEPLIERIFHWTSGQPLLVQRLAQFLYQLPSDQRTPGRLDAHVQETYLKGRIDSDTHLKFIRDYLLEPADAYDVSTIRTALLLYEGVLGRKKVTANRDEPAEVRLRLAGVVTVFDGLLVPRNRLYEGIFNAVWLNKNLPVDPLADTPVRRWLDNDRGPDFLLRGEALREAQRSTGPEYRAPDGLEFLVACGREEQADLDRQLKAASNEHEANRRAQLAVQNQLLAEQLAERQQREVERLKEQGQSTRRSQLVFIVVCLLSLGISIFLLLWQQANSASQLAIRKASIASKQESDAQELAKASEAARRTAETEKEKANEANEAKSRQAQFAQHQEHLAETAKKEADRQARIAEKATAQAKEQARLADKATAEAITQHRISESGRLAFRSLLALTSSSTVSERRNALRFAVDAVDEVAAHTTPGNDAVTALRKSLFFLEPETIIRQPGYVSRASFSSDGSRAVTASEDKTVRIWDVRTGNQLADLQSDLVVLDARFVRNNRRIVTTNSGPIELWDVLKGQRIRVPLFRADTTSLSADGTLLATTSDHTIRILDTLNGNILKEFTEDKNITYTSFSQDRQRMVIAYGDGTAAVLNIATQQHIVVFGHSDPIINTGGTRDASFSDDGSRIVTVNDDGKARIWNASSGQQLAVLSQGNIDIQTASFSSDGTRIATAGDDGTAGIWDSVSGKKIASLPQYDHVYSASFSNDGTRIITASADNIFRIWDGKTGQELAELEHDRRTNLMLSKSSYGSSGYRILGWRATFSNDGKRVITTDDDGVARIWNIDFPQNESLSELLSRARRRLASPLHRQSLRQSLQARPRVVVNSSLQSDKIR